MVRDMNKRIAVFASGNGSNAENLIKYFKESSHGAEVVLAVCNRPDAPVIEKAKRLGVETCIMTRADINDRDLMLGVLEQHSVDIVVLAGFLLMVPPFLIVTASSTYIRRFCLNTGAKACTEPTSTKQWSKPARQKPA